MSIVFALPRLFDAVVARFAAESVNVPNTFGWLAPAQQMEGVSRITWTPGDANGALGTVGAPKYVGQNPRQLATLFELCTVEIIAFDPVHSTDERAQYQITRELFDAWLRAVHLAAVGTYQIVGQPTWVAGDRGRRAGAALRVVLAIQAPVFDQPIEVAPVDTGAVINVSELDVSESLVVPPPTP